MWLLYDCHVAVININLMSFECHVVVMFPLCGVQSEEQQQLARHGADLTPSPRTGAIVDELLKGVVSDTFASGQSSAGRPEHEAQSQPDGAMLPEPEPTSPSQTGGALLPKAEPPPPSHGALQGWQPLMAVLGMLSMLVFCDDCSQSSVLRHGLCR